MKDKNKFSGIIFDFNGVLLWDTHWHDAAWMKMANQFREKPLTQQDMKQFVHGRTNKLILEFLLNRDLECNELQELTHLKESHYRNLCLASRKDFKLSPGAIELLDFLVKKNIPHTIATSSEKTNLDFFIEHLGLKRWFDVSKIAYDDGRMQSKPAPDIYLKAAKNLALKPSECIVVEDASSGVEAARRAGVGGIYHLVTDKTSSLKEVSSITSLAEIPLNVFAV